MDPKDKFQVIKGGNQAGADSLTKRRSEPYGFPEEFERGVVYHLCTSKKFYGVVGPHLDHSLFGSDCARWLVEAAQTAKVRLGDAPGDRSLVLETLAAFQREGRRTLEDVLAARDYLDYCEESSLAAPEAIIKLLVPTLQRRLDQEIMREANDAYGKRRGPDEIKKLLRKRDGLGVMDTNIGVISGPAAEAEILTLSFLEKLPTGINEIDGPLKGGLPRGSFYVFMAGTGGGKSMITTQICTHAVFLGMCAAVATFELSQALQMARHYANLTGYTVDDIMANPKPALKKADLMYPNRGLFITKYFSPRKATVQSILDWHDDTQQQLGREVHMLAIDYLNKVKLAVEGRDANKAKHEQLDEASDLILDYGKEKNIWIIGGVAPKPSAGKPRKLGKDMSHSDTDDTGGAHALAKNADGEICLDRYEDENGGDLQIVPFCAKNRLGKDRWRANPLYPDFERARITSNPVHLNAAMDIPEEILAEIAGEEDGQ